MNGQGQPAAALTWYDQAIRTLKPVLHKAPQHSKARQCLRIAHEGRAQTLIHLGEHARAAADLKEIAKIQGLAPDDCYNLACLNALCSAAAGKDQKLPAAQRTKLAEDYAHEALRLLRDAIARGYQDVAHLKKDPDFDALRAREDFQKLVRELEAKVKPGKKP
jgi:tetratricopeptide (TPR) repeat protein